MFISFIISGLCSIIDLCLTPFVSISSTSFSFVQPLLLRSSFQPLRGVPLQILLSPAVVKSVLRQILMSSTHLRSQTPLTKSSSSLPLAFFLTIVSFRLSFYSIWLIIIHSAYILPWPTLSCLKLKVLWMVIHRMGLCLGVILVGTFHWKILTNLSTFSNDVCF